MNYLTDLNFLSDLSKYKQKTIYGRITALTFDEKPVEQIEGKIISGSINVDGKSAVRRSCSLQMISEGIDLNNFIWTLNTKYKLEIGLYNFIDQTKYPEILWFPQGVYVITNFSSSISTSSVSISISGKDKMVLLNGEVSGHFGQSTILDSIEELNKETQTYIKRKYEIKNIIKDMVYTLGNERLENIYINDLDEYGLKMLNYIGQSDLYIKQRVDSNTWLPIELDYQIQTELEAGLEVNEEWVVGQSPLNLGFEAYNGNITINFSTFNTNTELESQPLFKTGEEDYFLLYKLSYGDIAGYEATPIVFNDDLIAQPGETITAMLDKINSMFGNSYEYFYDLNGKFIFQKKKTYLDTSWTPVSFYVDGDAVVMKDNGEEFIFEFLDNELVNSISINPGVDKVKNDFIVYGETENKHPIHLRYAIDKKPVKYTSWDGTAYYASGEEIGEVKKPQVTDNNWQELTYHPNQLIHPRKTAPYFSMSVRNFNKEIEAGHNLVVDNFIRINEKEEKVYKIIAIESSLLGTRKRIYLNDPEGTLESLAISNVEVYSGELTEFQTSNKYVDWRELIYQMAEDFHAHGQDDDYLYQMRDRNPQMFSNGKSGYEQYYTDIMGFWPEVYRDENGEPGWNLAKLADPNTMLYWLEFLDGNSQFEAISIPNIGDRTKVASNKKSTALFEPNVPPLLFYITETVPATTLIYTPIKLSADLQTAFSLASFPTAAKTVMDEELNNFTSFARSVNLSTVPIYNLDVNRKVRIATDEVRGQFIIDRLTIPLNYNGMMSIGLNEITDNLY